MLKARRPSPSMLVAVTALFVALGGSVYAANRIGPKQLAKNAVSTPKIQKKAVTRPKIAPAAISSRQIADGSVTGVKVDEGSLGKVPTAVNADTVGGMVPSSFSFKGAPNTALTPIKTIGLLTIHAGCAADGDPLLTVFPADPGGPSLTMSRAVLAADAVDTGGAGSVDPGGVVMLDGTHTISVGEIQVMSTTGKVTTISWGARDNTVFNPSEDVCVVWGTGLAS
jgi:hypothetical protein